VDVIQRVGKEILKYVEDLGLLLIAVATVVAIAQEALVMWEVSRVELADLLLLFIYLEVLTMVVVYLESGKLPVRIPVYIAIVALARYLILDMKSMGWEKMLAVAAAALVLALAVLAIRYGHVRFPYDNEPEQASVPRRRRARKGKTSLG